MVVIAISSKRSYIWQAYRFLCVFSFQAWKSLCIFAWMRYRTRFSQLHSQGNGDHWFPGPPSIEGQHSLDMQFHLKVMACLPFTNIPPNSCSDAKNGFFWISIRQIYSS